MLNKHTEFTYSVEYVGNEKQPVLMCWRKEILGWRIYQYVACRSST